MVMYAETVAKAAAAGEKLDDKQYAAISEKIWHPEDSFDYRGNRDMLSAVDGMAQLINKCALSRYQLFSGPCTYVEKH